MFNNSGKGVVGLGKNQIHINSNTNMDCSIFLFAKNFFLFAGGALQVQWSDITYSN